MIEPPDKITFPGLASQGRVSRRLQDHLGLLNRRPLRQGAPERQEAQRARQGGGAEAPQHPQIRLEYGAQTLYPVRMPVTARLFFLRMVDKVVRLALQRALLAAAV